MIYIYILVVPLSLFIFLSRDLVFAYIAAPDFFGLHDAVERGDRSGGWEEEKERPCLEKSWHHLQLWKVPRQCFPPFLLPQGLEVS